MKNQSARIHPLSNKDKHVDDVFCVVIEGEMEGDNIRGGEELIDGNVFSTDFSEFLILVNVIGEEVHSESLGDSGEAHA